MKSTNVRLGAKSSWVGIDGPILIRVPEEFVAALRDMTDYEKSTAALSPDVLFLPADTKVIAMSRLVKRMEGGGK